MLTTVISNIKELQAEGILPKGKYEYTFQNHPFSFILRISIDGHIFFLKKLKHRSGASSSYIEEKLNREYNALTKFCPFFAKEKYFNIPRVVYCSVKDLIIVTEELKGITLSEISRDYASQKNIENLSNAPDVFLKAGKFLKLFHESETYPYTLKDLYELTDYIKIRLFRGIFNKKEKAEISYYLIQCQSDIENNIQKYKKTPVHSDFGPGNILFYGESINVLDFGDYRIDNCFQDIVYFKLMLERHLENRLRYRKSAKEELFKAFSKGYGFDYQTSCKDKLYQLFLLRNLAIFITTMTWRKEFQGQLIEFIKKNILDFIEYYKIKNKILFIIKKNYKQ